MKIWDFYNASEKLLRHNCDLAGKIGDNDQGWPELLDHRIQG